MRFLVPRQRKRGRLVSLQRVAPLARVQVRSPGELPIMFILVAIGAAPKLDLEERVFAFGDMTLRTLHCEVFPFERISRGGVLFRRERRGLEAFYRVAPRALRASGPLRKLSVMRIGLVTIHALRKCNRLFEISTRVAARAIHRPMLALERVLRLPVVKVLTHHRQRNSLPRSEEHTS